MDQYDIPILFIVFRRLDTTRRVFEEIRKQRPKTLFVVADGPRIDRPEEAAQCAAVREYIIKNVDWPCNLQTLFRDENWGVRRSPPDAISWFFSRNKYGIILEDDCVPNESFFRFMKEMLERYADNERVMSVGGHISRLRPTNGASYFFSQLPNIWGWGTWCRAWAAYDIHVATYPDFKKNKNINQIFDSDYCRTQWLSYLDQAYKKDFNSWDVQWAYALLERRGLAIAPVKNLVLNIGFDNRSSHIFSNEAASAEPLQEDLSFPLSHPPEISFNKKEDERDSKHAPHFRKIKYIFYKLGLFGITERIYRKLRNFHI
jgi:hypothetical protein